MPEKGKESTVRWGRCFLRGSPGRARTYNPKRGQSIGEKRPPGAFLLVCPDCASLSLPPAALGSVPVNSVKISESKSQIKLEKMPVYKDFLSIHSITQWTGWTKKYSKTDPKYSKKYSKFYCTIIWTLFAGNYSCRWPGML